MYKDTFDTMVRIQKLCTELNAEIFSLKDICKQMGSVVDDDDRKQYVYYTEKMNEVRSYLVFQSKEIDNRRTYLRNEIAFYDFGKKA